MLSMCSQILNYVDVRDCVQACKFFNSLQEVGYPDKFANENNNDKLIAAMKKIGNDMNESKENNENVNTNDFYQFCSVIGWEFDINTIRAIIGVALATGSQNSAFREKASIFCDNEKKQLFYDSKHVLMELNSIVDKNIEYNYKVWKENEEIEKLYQIHTNPLLPDNVDMFGNLPLLTCAWSKCGQVFTNRDRLFAHVARVTKKPLAHRFHLYCRQILEPDPNQSYDQFLKAVRKKFDDSGRKALKMVKDEKIKTYYQQFVPIFTSKA